MIFSLALVLFVFIFSLLKTTKFPKKYYLSLCIQMMVVLCLMVFRLRTNSAIDPSSLSGLPKENIICSYFSTGFPYKGILQFLLIYHNIKLCYLRCVIYVAFFVNKSYFWKNEMYHREKYWILLLKNQESGSSYRY